MGAGVLLDRDSDKDLSEGVRNGRKKRDFDNRIKLINKSEADMYLSIHLNYLSNSFYKGPQVFYDKDNKNLANYLQKYLNKYLDGDREIKNIPSNTYMYKKLKIPGVLIECGFLSNASERQKLVTEEYQIKLAKTITNAIVDYYN